MQATTEQLWQYDEGFRIGQRRGSPRPFSSVHLMVGWAEGLLGRYDRHSAVVEALYRAGMRRCQRCFEMSSRPLYGGACGDCTDKYVDDEPRVSMGS